MLGVWDRLLPLAAVMGCTVLIAGCGASEAETSSSSANTGAPASASAGAVSEAGGQRRAETIFERTGLSYYIGVLKPSTVRFMHECRQADVEEDESKTIPGEWQCAGWGLITIEGSEGKPGECEFVEGNVTAHGLVGKPTGNAQSFSGSPCQLNIGLGSPSKKPKPNLVAAWTHKQQSEAQRSREIESSPEAQAQRNEEAKEQREEAERTEEARQAEHGE